MKHTRIQILKRYSEICRDRGARLTENPATFFTGPDYVYPAYWYGRSRAANAMIAYELRKFAEVIRDVNG